MLEQRTCLRDKKNHVRNYSHVSFAVLFNCTDFLYVLALAYKEVDYDYKAVHLVKGEQV